MTINELKRNIKLNGAYAIKVYNDIDQKQQCQELLLNNGFKWNSGSIHLNVSRLKIDYFTVNNINKTDRFYILYGRNIEKLESKGFRTINFTDFQDHIKIGSFVDELFNEVI